MKCLIVRPPFAEYIVNSIKTIEYRSRKTNIRGRIGIIESGTLSSKGKMVKRGSGYLRCTLMNVAMVVISNNHTFYEYYHKKRYLSMNCRKYLNFSVWHGIISALTAGRKRHDSHREPESAIGHGSGPAADAGAEKAENREKRRHLLAGEQKERGRPGQGRRAFCAFG